MKKQRQVMFMEFEIHVVTKENLEWHATPPCIDGVVWLPGRKYAEVPTSQGMRYAFVDDAIIRCGGKLYVNCVPDHNAIITVYDTPDELLNLEKLYVRAATQGFNVLSDEEAQFLKKNRNQIVATYFASFYAEEIKGATKATGPDSGDGEAV